MESKERQPRAPNILSTWTEQVHFPSLRMTLSREKWEFGEGVRRRSERKKCEISKGGPGDARWQEKHLELQFPPPFCQRLVPSWVLFQFSSFKRLFNSWYRWDHQAPRMIFGSSLWMPENKNPPSTRICKSSQLLLSRDYSSSQDFLQNCLHRIWMRTDREQTILRIIFSPIIFLVSYVSENKTHHRPDPKFREIPRYRLYMPLKIPRCGTFPTG